MIPDSAFGHKWPVKGKHKRKKKFAKLNPKYQIALNLLTSDIDFAKLFVSGHVNDHGNAHEDQKHPL